MVWAPRKYGSPQRASIAGLVDAEELLATVCPMVGIYEAKTKALKGAADRVERTRVAGDAPP